MNITQLDPIIRKKYSLKSIYLISMIPIILISWILDNYNIKIDTILGIDAILLALIALSITIKIALTQDKQLNTLENIGCETKETTNLILIKLGKLEK